MDVAMEVVMDDAEEQNLPQPLDAGPEIEEFANALDDCLSLPLSPSEKRDRILDLPRKYYENTIRRLDQLRPNKARDGGNDDVDMDADADEADTNNDSVGSPEEIKALEKEAQTWDLLRRLLPLRYPTSNGSDAATFRSSRNPKPLHNELLNDFLLSDSLARERHAVLRWLQSNASSGPDIDEVARDLQQNADRGDIVAHGWLHTRSSIKLRKSVTAWPHLLDRQAPGIAKTHLNSDSAPLVTQLDPDAPTRQGRKLEPQDEYFERAIWLGCYEHLRRGSSLKEIRDWCHERTEMWRAISTSATLLSVDESDLSAESSPESLALWRRMCFGLARNGGCDDYERAVYGILSGDITSVEKVAITWDNFMFANFNALLRTQLDTYILGLCPPGVASHLNQTFSAFDAIQFHGDPKTVEKRLVNALEAHKQVQNEATEPNKALQASFISREISRHLFEQGLVLSASTELNSAPKLLSRLSSLDQRVNKKKFFKADQYDGIRIVAHVYLLLVLLEKLGGKPENSPSLSLSPVEWRRAQENIIAGYTNYLRLAHLQELIPLYCSILEVPRRYEVLSSNLISEVNPNHRRIQLKLMKKAGIDELEFVQAQAWLIYDGLGPFKTAFSTKESLSIVLPGPPSLRYGRMVKPDFFGEDDQVIEETHENLIRSLEWLLLVDGTWANVFAVGSKIYKFLLRNMHLNAARHLMKRVSFKDVVRRLGGQEELDGPWLDHTEFWAEQVERSEILGVTAEKVASDARSFKELEQLVQALDTLETLASMAGVVAEDNSEPPRKFWTEVGVTISKAKEHMQPLLSNWLLTGIEEGDDELKEVRRGFLTETVLAYVSALHFTGTALSRDNLLECMELASVIAERNSDLATSFVEAGRMKELVESLTACSKALAISTGEKRSAGLGNKKLREMGWSRDIWSVKP